MSRPFRLTTLLSDKHWHPFHALLADRRATVDGARDWLRRRGYKVSRGAVGNYLRIIRRSPRRALGCELAGKSDAELRRTLRGRAAQLADPELLTLALFAAFLAGADAEPGGRKAAPVGRK